MPSSDKIQNCSLASLLEACKENCDPFKSKGHLGYLYPTFSACNVEDLGSIPGLRRFPGEGKGYSLQYSGLENYLHQTVHEVSVQWGTGSYCQGPSIILVPQSFQLFAFPYSLYCFPQKRPNMFQSHFSFTRFSCL